MRSVLSNLVNKANFLVEENLKVLVENEELDERERQLFRLDSILTAIGVEGKTLHFPLHFRYSIFQKLKSYVILGEEEIFHALRRHKHEPDRAKVDILKIIRSELEEN